MSDVTSSNLSAVARAIGTHPELMGTFMELIPEEARMSAIFALLHWTETAVVGPTRISVMQIMEEGVGCPYCTRERRSPDAPLGDC